MAFQLSPGVVITEEDKTTIVPSVATTAGAFAGAFQWGPVEEVTTIDTETNLVGTFGKPNDTTYGYFFTAANFLAYGNNLKVARVVDKGVARNAVSVATGRVISAYQIYSNTYLSSDNLTITFDDPTGDTSDPDQRTALGTVALQSSGSIRDVYLSSRGFGYNTPPTVTFANVGSGTGAVATAVLGEGVLTAITVTAQGNNYSALSNVVIENAGVTNSTANLEIHYNLYDIGIANGGDGYDSNAYIEISGGGLVAGGTQATATPVITGNIITGIIITNNGNGYISAPNVTIHRGNTFATYTANAVLGANVGYGYINRILVATAGSGHTYAPNVIINKNAGAGVGGNNATATSRIAAQINSIVISNGGSGYTSTTNVVITPHVSDIPYLTGNAVAGANVQYFIQGITVTNGGVGYTQAPNAYISLNGVRQNQIVVVVSYGTNNPLIENTTTYLNEYQTGNYLYGVFAARYPGVLGNALKVSLADSTSYANWEYASLFDSQPGTSAFAAARGGQNDELHIVVIDATGDWTGTAGTVLEKYQFLSKATDAKSGTGASSYYRDVIANQSKYIWVIDDPGVGVNWGSSATNKSFGTLTANITNRLSGGVSGDSVSLGNVINGFELFSNDELYDVSLIPLGPTTDVSAVNSVIDIVNTRRDCVAFISPPAADIINTTGQAAKIITYRNLLTDSSFAVMDSGWKYQYDRYNDKYRYIPLNGDIAGLAARTDYIADPWYSPAGYSRGVLKNVVKLPYSPTKTDRDELYKKNINPVVTLPGQGTVLFGDKTLQSRPSAFDRINVRRLFIVLEKSISTASRFQLFEFNDAFTRGQFRNLVEPFLRDVQGRRGITDFRVVCDETNNTAAVIDRNEFVADIYIKPARAINFIQLNFVATRSGVSFEEVGA